MCCRRICWSRCHFKSALRSFVRIVRVLMAIDVRCAQFTSGRGLCSRLLDPLRRGLFVHHYVTIRYTCRSSPYHLPFCRFRRFNRPRFFSKRFYRIPHGNRESMAGQINCRQPCWIKKTQTQENLWLSNLPDFKSARLLLESRNILCGTVNTLDCSLYRDKTMSVEAK